MPVRTSRSSAVDSQAISAWEESVQIGEQQKVLVKIAERRMFRTCGYTRSHEGEVEWLDTLAVAERVFDIVSEAVVKDKDDRETVPLARNYVVGRVLDQYPAPPSDEFDALDPIEREAWKQASATIWKLIQVKPHDRMQRWAAERLDSGMLVIKTDEQTVFVTAESKYQRAELLQPHADKAVLAAAAMGELFAGYARHNNALKAPAQSLLKATAKSIDAKSGAAFLAKAPEDTDE
jgi:hypothetical protein